MVTASKQKISWTDIVMKQIISYVALIIAISIFFFVLSNCSAQDREEARKRSAIEEQSLKDMSIPPVLSERQRDPSWSIRSWVGADKIHGDCRIAHEYMDDGTLEKTIRKRRGGTGTTHNIFEYLKSCKNAGQRAMDLVSPRAKKWCHYRSTDARLNELCEEWEKNGASYISTIELQYRETESRFREMTGGAYDEDLTKF